MQKRICTLLLCVLLLFPMAAPSAQAAEYICFVAAEENILPLSDKTMPFWQDGYLYIPSSIFTGAVRGSLGISHSSNSAKNLVILYNNSYDSLVFEAGKDYAYDRNNTHHSPGAVQRDGVIFVPASLVARFFGLQYSVAKVSTQANGKTTQADLAWIRQPGSVLTDKVFANAASYQIANRYANYLKEKIPDAADSSSSPEEPDDMVIEGGSIYLCFAAGNDTAAMLDALDTYHAQAAFFCTPEFLEMQGDLLRRMAATGQSVGILANAEDEEYTVTEQLERGNRALNRATCGKTRLVYVQNSNEEVLQAVREAGYCPLEPELNRSGYGLRTAANASNLLQRLSEFREATTVWLADTANAAGLRRFLIAARNADGRCLAWTETA